MVQSFVSRRDTVERWQSALKRANDKGVHVYRIESTGQFIATSGTTVTTAYATDGVSCECAAAVHGDPVCQHRAAYWAAQGMLTLDESPTLCTFCRGTGEFWAEGDWSASACGCCGGRGSYPAVVDRVPATNIIPFPTSDDRRPAA